MRVARALLRSSSRSVCSGARISTTLWHNPACSKSRAALAVLEERGEPFEVREYLAEPPSFSELEVLKSALGLPAIEWVRTMDEAWIDHFDGATKYDDLLPDDDDIMRAIEKRPIMLERPICMHGDRAVVGRPTELIIALLDGELPRPSANGFGALAAAALSGRKEADDPIATISRLKGLLDTGALSQAEFDAKKSELLAKIS